MEKTADVVIVGGGVVGASIAYHLALKKAGRIILLEKGQMGEGSTGRCVGGVRTQFSTEINIRLSLESLKTFERFKEEFGVDPEFRRIGYLFLASTGPEMDIFKENVKPQRRFGIPVELLDTDEIKKRWPFLRTDDLRGGTFCSSDGVAGPSEVLQGFVNSAKRAGVRIYEGEEVVGITLKNDRVSTVRTKKEEICTPVVVNAAGPFAARVGEMAGIKIPVKPVRRQIFDTAPFQLSNHSIPLTIDFHRGWYFRQEGEGLLLSGPMDEQPSFNLDTDYEGMTEAADNATYRIPVLEKARIARGWAGLYEISPDHHAILGRTPGVEGFILANGFSGHGFQHSPAVGRTIAELIVEEKTTTIDISSLSIERFSRGESIFEPMTAFKD
jgi:sarcosine oxidase, subunit beta